MLNLVAKTVDLEQQIITLGIRTTLIAAFLLVVASVTAILLKKHKSFKLPLFILMAGTLVVSTVILFGSTIYLNTHADSKGPVHWHADIEFWACDAELNLRDPHGTLSNKIGTATYHEHNDKRIHLEGVVVKKAEDASLEKFMRVVDGYVTYTAMAVPLNEDPAEWFASGDQLDGDEQNTERFNQLRSFVNNGSKGPYMELKNGALCNGKPAELQAFLYTYDEANKTYSQRKLDDPAKYIMRDESVVPPGDCLIIDFDVNKPRTDKLCRQYGVRDTLRCEEFGVEEPSAELCNLRQTAGQGGNQ